MSKDLEAVIEEIEEVVEKTLDELFDGLYGGWFTPEELDLVLEALKYYAHEKTTSDPDKAKQVFDLLEAMTELREKGE